MNKTRIIFSCLMFVLTTSAAYGQVNLVNNQTKTVSGTVTNMDYAGSTISIQTEDQHKLSFSVPGNAIIVQDSHDIGLMDIKGGHPVTIQYDVSSPGKNMVESIVDNQTIKDPEEE